MLERVNITARDTLITASVEAIVTNAAIHLMAIAITVVIMVATTEAIVDLAAVSLEERISALGFVGAFAQGFVEVFAQDSDATDFVAAIRSSSIDRVLINRVLI